MSEVTTEAGVEVANLPAIAINRPLAVLQDQETHDALIAEIEAEVAAFVPDLTTDKGRKAIKSLAFKVVRTKTAIDEAGKTFNEEARAQVAKIDEARRGIRTKLDSIRDQVKAPLVEWEAAEAKRVEKVKADLAELHNAAVIPASMTADQVQARVVNLEEMDLDPKVFAEQLVIAEGLRTKALEALREALARITREDAERAELEALREEKRRREEEDRKREEERQAEDSRRRYVESVFAHIRNVRAGLIGDRAETFPVLIHELERKVEIDDRFGDRADEARALLAESLADLRRRHDDFLEAARKRVAAEAAAKAKADAKAAAERAEARRREEAERKHQEQLAEERRQREALEAENRRREEAARQAEEERQKREADTKHRNEVLSAAAEAIRNVNDLHEQDARAIVDAIAAGEIPAVSITF